MTVRRLPLPPTIFALILGLGVALILGTLFGEVALSLENVVRGLLHPLFPFVPAPNEETTSLILLQVRLPRVVLAALVGATLSVCGAALQGLLGNPLADPYSIGVSSGAAVGAGMAMLLGIAGLWGGLGQSGSAFLAALLTMWLVLSLSQVDGQLQRARFLLAGIVVGSLAWSIVTLLLWLLQRDPQAILLFLLGGFNGKQWSEVGLMLPFAVGATGAFTVWGRGLDAFAFGEEMARSVGVEVEPFKRSVLTVAALTTAVAVSVSGVIGFVGLVVPHIARSLVGPRHRGLIPVSALIGAILLVLADIAARLVRPGDELPVGIVTALLGAPFFLTLLRRQE